MVKVSMQQNNETKNEYKFGAEGSTPTPSGDISNEQVTFTEASTRANISTGETLAVICGKIKKFFADLKTVAFSGDYDDLTNKPTIPTVNNATLTIKQGGTTKGTFTANASTDVEIDLDAGGGGGSTYTAGDGIDITNNVISVENPIVKTPLNIINQTVPMLYTNSNADEHVLLKEDGTVATLSDCLDLGVFTGDLGSYFLKYLYDIDCTGAAKVYDYSTQQQTTENFTYAKPSSTSQLAGGSVFTIFDNTAQLLIDGITVGNNTVTLYLYLGVKNGHIYAFSYVTAYGSLSTESYVQSLTGTIKCIFTQI